MSELLKEKARDEFLRLGEKEQGVSVGGLNQKAQSLAATKFIFGKSITHKKSRSRMMISTKA